MFYTINNCTRNTRPLGFHKCVCGKWQQAQKLWMNWRPQTYTSHLLNQIVQGLKLQNCSREALCVCVFVAFLIGFLPAYAAVCCVLRLLYLAENLQKLMLDVPSGILHSTLSLF